MDKVKMSENGKADAMNPPLDSTGHSESAALGTQDVQGLEQALSQSLDSLTKLITHQVQKNPVQSALIAAGLGFAAALWFTREKK